MKLSHYTKVYPCRERPGYLLFFSTKKASTVLLREAVFDSIANGTLSPSDRETLSRLGFVVSDTGEEKRTMEGYLERVNASNVHFNLTVVMNLNCNLSCLYCYEGTMKGNFYMTYDTADRLVDFVKGSFMPHKKSLNIDFYGGEPLLSLGLIKYISAQLKDFARERNVSFAFTLITNGTLLNRRTAEELAALGLKGVKICLDGSKGNHDKYRPLKSGESSFDLIIKNIKETCDIIKIGIGGNFNRESYKTFPELLDYLIGQGLKPDRIASVKFDPIMKPDGNLSPTDFRDGCESINEPWLVEAGFELREEILRRGFRTSKIIPSPCMAYISDDYVINYDGTIYKCPGLIGRKEFEIGSLSAGIRDYKVSYNLDLWKNPECLDCEYLPLCLGGCRYMKFLRDGNLEGVDCKRPYLDATLETFIKQDITYRKG